VKMAGKKYFVVSIVGEKGIALTEVDSKKRAVNKLGETWLGFAKEDGKNIVGYDFAVFVGDGGVTVEDLLKNDKLVNCLKELATCIKNFQNQKNKEKV